eukprot:15365197-Ditylum_brightwellii.AAC.1
MSPPKKMTEYHNLQRISDLVTAYQAVSVANNAWIVPRSALPGFIKDNSGPNYGRLRVGRTDGKACSVDSMTQLDPYKNHEEAWDW